MPDRQQTAARMRAQAPITTALAGWMALAVGMGIGRFAFTPILPMMQQDAGLSVADGGWLASANYLGYFLGALSIPAVRVGAAVAIRGGLIAIGLVTLAMGLTDSFAAWMLLRALAGVASAWVLVCVSAWSTEALAPLGRPMLGAAVFAGVGTGIAVAGGLCLALMYAGRGSVPAWILFGAVSLVVAGLLWPAFASSAQPVPSHASARAETGRPAGWLRLVLCYGSFGFGYIIPATFLPVMARAVIHDPAVFGWSWPVFGAAAAASTFAAAAWSVALGNRRLWIIGHLVMALGVMLPVFWPGMTAIILAALCVGGSFMVVTMVGMQEARQVAGAGTRSLMAAMTAAFALGQIAGPLLVSALAGMRDGFSLSLAFAGVLLAASAWALRGARPAKAS
jgi:MFS family permease